MIVKCISEMRSSVEQTLLLVRTGHKNTDTVYERNSTLRVNWIVLGKMVVLNWLIFNFMKRDLMLFGWQLWMWRWRFID